MPEFCILFYKDLIKLIKTWHASVMVFCCQVTIHPRPSGLDCFIGSDDAVSQEFGWGMWDWLVSPLVAPGSSYVWLLTEYHVDGPRINQTLHVGTLRLSPLLAAVSHAAMDMCTGLMWTQGM